MTNKLKEALYEEHCCLCLDNTCDILAAYDAGLFLWAARLLIGATECPLTEEAFVADSVDDSELNAERDMLLELPHFPCQSCKSIIWRDDEPGVICGNCCKENPSKEVADWVHIAGSQQPDDQPFEDVNSLRHMAERAEKLLVQYSDYKNEYGETSLVDLLTDFMHLCDKCGWGFHELVHRAERHYIAEINGDL